MRPRTAADLDLQRARTDGVLCRFFFYFTFSVDAVSTYNIVVAN